MTTNRISEEARLAEMAGKLRKMNRDELIEMARQMAAMESKLKLHGPQDDDQLHTWIKETVGIDIPRVSVCPDHDAPFKFFSDMYFNRCDTAAILMANRGGSKTFLVALLHLVNSKFKPRCESATIGAIEAQARRAYAHLLKFMDIVPELKEDLASSIMSETRWKNGSRVEVLPGTIAAVNGPHPQIVHFDEVELADEDAFYESRNMSLSGHGIPAQDIITSTRKRGAGLMQRLIDEITDAQSQGFIPPYRLYQWCVFETTTKQRNCQVANPHIDEEHRCTCDKVVKGKWDNGEPRRFSDICQGRLAKSEGWMTLDDVHKTFMADSRDIWEAQQECIKPSTEGMVLPRFAVERHGIRGFMPDPDNGPIFAGIDFGGTNPHAVIWFQVLRYEVDVESAGGGTKRLPEGSVVAFDEFYKSEIGNNKLAEAIVNREAFWANKFPGFTVIRRFADPQGKAARLDLHHYTPKINTSFYVSRDVKEHIKALVALIDDELFYVDTVRCPMWVAEAQAWHYPKMKAGMIDDPEKPVEDFDHAMAATRYGVSNLLYMERRWGRQLRSPGVRERDSETGRFAPTTTEGVGRSGPAIAGPRRYSGSQSPIPFRQRIQP